MSEVKFYTPAEERLNIGSHAVGAILSLIGTLFLVIKSTELGLEAALSVGTYGVCMLLLYVASTSYHAAKEPSKRARLRIFDHAAIYLLIAGTYTPFAALALEGTTGNTVLAIIWSAAIVGILLKLKFTGRYNLVSTILYVLMGWVAIFYINPLREALPEQSLWLILAGGICYTLGAVIYMFKIPFAHATFHFAVLGGSACHFFAVVELLTA